jgi:prepilin-type N-terminal cleavage/methylation domain-containing protein
MSTFPLRPRAFTLIEVLIGIIVLALGLLGLAAIFPAVVVQQRSASDAVQGESVAKSAKSMLLGFDKLNAPVNGWDAARDVPAVGRKTLGAAMVGTSDIPSWELPFVGTAGSAAFVSDSDTGQITIGDPTKPTTLVKIPARARLFPLPRRGSGSVSDEPRYVWDFAVRRIISRAEGGNRRANIDDPLQVAIFVRRIDTGIRRGAPGDEGATLHDRFELSAGGNFDYMPVVVDSNGVPTFDGRLRPGLAEYSGINRVSFDFSGDAVVGSDRMWVRDRLVNGTATALTTGELPFYAQVGQKVLLESGKLLIVTSIDDQGRMVFDKKVDRTDIDAATGVGYYGLMTPQIPAAIELFVIEKPSVQ